MRLLIRAPYVPVAPSPDGFAGRRGPPASGTPAHGSPGDHADGRRGPRRPDARHTPPWPRGLADSGNALPAALRVAGLTPDPGPDP